MPRPNPTGGTSMDFLSSLRRQSLILALCYLLIGIFFVLWPGTAVDVIVRVIAMGALIVGAIRIVEFFSSRKYDRPFSNSLAGGVVLAVLGIFMLARPQVIVSILYVLLGGALILNGILAVQSAMDLWHFQPQRKLVLLALGLLTLILGVIVLLNPFSTARALVLVSGVFLIIGGATDLVSLFSVLNVTKSSGRKE
ncbi:MAG TPA: hypothetical protein DDW99_01745 [Ruminococcaceae bacterium]|nr:hypothetical protein [Oscillospiraceae bacterium]HCB91985.1 hypothetical protein [Oscillospiraceae bacterium]